MTINIFHRNRKENKLLLLIIKNQETIMATIQELTQKVDDLQTALDAEQEQVLEAIGKLETTVAELKDIIVSGGTVEERQALADKLTAITEDLKGTIPDETNP